MVSVIIPVYNGSKYIKQTIESAIRQSYKDWELIIIDDRSTDNSWDIIQAVKSKYPGLSIETIRHDTNKGCPAASRNTGIRKAKGEYIALLDQDDLWYTDKLKKQLEIIEHDPKTDLVLCDVDILDNHTDKITKRNFTEWENIAGLDREALINRIIKKNFVLTGSVALARKSFFDKFGLLDEHYKIADDYELWLQVARLSKISFLSEPLAVWRKSGFSTSSNLENMYKDLVYFYQKRKSEGYTSNNLGKYLYYLGSLYFKEKRYKESRDLYLKSRSTGYNSYAIALSMWALHFMPSPGSRLLGVSNYLILGLKRTARRIKVIAS